MVAEPRAELFVNDLDACVDFYTRVLAFEIADDRRNADDPYVLLRRDRVRVGASRAWKPVDRESRLPPAGVEIAIDVDDEDFAEEVSRVRASGCPWFEPPQPRPWGVTDFRILDPDGYYVCISDRTGSGQVV